MEKKKAMSSQTAPNIKYKETQQKKARLRESYMKCGWEKSKKSCRTADCTSSSRWGEMLFCGSR